MAARYKAAIETPHRPRTCFEARVPRDGKKDLVALFGGMTLLRNGTGFIADPVPVLVPTPPQGADPPAPHTKMRAVRAGRHGGCPPGRQARPARDICAGKRRSSQCVNPDLAAQPTLSTRTPAPRTTQLPRMASASAVPRSRRHFIQQRQHPVVAVSDPARTPLQSHEVVEDALIGLG